MQHETEVERSGTRHGQKLNWLRAAVLGANDGIVSTASLVVGVAGATSSVKVIVTAGVAGLVAGALSMGVGEYVSVSTQLDTEKALIEKERHELETNPEYEFEELVAIYKAKGLSDQTARTAAHELADHDEFAAHLDAELGIDPNNLANPWHAAYASALAFFLWSDYTYRHGCVFAWVGTYSCYIFWGVIGACVNWQPKCLCWRGK
jgi:VIT1/CCC1 family predicted Fe2+/Mn2+ transporter